MLVSFLLGMYIMTLLKNSTLDLDSSWADVDYGGGEMSAMLVY